MSKRRYISLISLLLSSWLAGCATPPIQDGRLPPVELLSSLVVGSSSVTEVENTLGVPRGRGKVKHSGDTEARDIIYYEFIQLKGDQIGLKLLLVFLKDDIYDGHLWFGAQELIEKQL